MVITTQDPFCLDIVLIDDGENMGHYGYKPFENDQAGTVIDEVFEMLHKHFNKRDFDYDEVRGAASVLLKLGKIRVYIDDKILDDAIECYEEILQDKDWMDDWSEPSFAKREIRKEYNALKKRKEDN